jgi:hypothetical protein
MSDLLQAIENETQFAENPDSRTERELQRLETEIKRQIMINDR